MIKIDKIFGDKKTNAFIYILLAVGIVMLLWGENSGKVSQKEVPRKSVYENSEEQHLEQILSKIEGVGRVSVMICTKQSDAGESQMVFSSQSDSLKKTSGGVLVVARGGADIRVQEKIIRAVNAAMGVEPHKIQVLERVVCEDDDGD